MPFDFKKEYKEWYMPKKTPQIVDLPACNYIAISGSGDPNEEDGAYQKALKVLYSLAYTLKMSNKTDHVIEGYFPYVVPPLDGLWWSDKSSGIDYGDKSSFQWISMIRLPDFIKEEDFQRAVKTAENKKKIDCSKARFLRLEEGLCVQIMHIGSYDEEPASIEKTDAFLAENGHVCDLSDTRRHHEIYLSDPRRTKEENRKTVIRHPIRKA